LATLATVAGCTPDAESPAPEPTYYVKYWGLNAEHDFWTRTSRPIKVGENTWEFYNLYDDKPRKITVVNPVTLSIEQN
jgi:hypothetical protein